MTKNTSVNFAFTARRIEMALLVLTAAIGQMATKKSTAADSREAAFYEEQIPKFQALVDLLTKTQNGAGKDGATRKARLSEQQFRMLSGALGHRNLAEVMAIHEMASGAEQDKRQAAHEEWAEFHQALDAKDPRQYDTSQDAEEEEEEPESDDE